jgi:hypothetical protein
MYNSMTEQFSAFEKVNLEFDDMKIDTEVELRHLILREIKNFHLTRDTEVINTNNLLTDLDNSPRGRTGKVPVIKTKLMNKF